MLISAHKLVLATVILAGGLLSFASLASAGSANSKFDAVGLADAVPLQDMQMAELRGTGFLNGVTQGLLGTLTPAGRAALASGAQSTLHALTGFIPALISVLPPGNTVSAQLGDQPIVTLNGTGPQSLGCGGGITCGAGTSFALSSSTNPALASVSISFTLH
jgi:hypothetical protein